MKKIKRNAVIVTVVLFVCAAVYLNWSYGKNGEDAKQLANASADADAVTLEEGDSNEAGLYYEVDGAELSSGGYANTAYFDEVRLARQQARDEAVTTLSTVTENEDASQETIDAALSKITALAEYRVLEAELESLITAKGFEECIVYISDSGVNVSVPAPEEGLSEAAVARITDVITGETGYKAEELKIIEVK